MASARSMRDIVLVVRPAIERLIAEQEKTNERLAALEKLTNAPKPVSHRRVDSEKWKSFYSMPPWRTGRLVLFIKAINSLRETGTDTVYLLLQTEGG